MTRVTQSIGFMLRNLVQNPHPKPPGYAERMSDVWVASSSWTPLSLEFRGQELEVTEKRELFLRRLPSKAPYVGSWKRGEKFNSCSNPCLGTLWFLYDFTAVPLLWFSQLRASVPVESCPVQRVLSRVQLFATLWTLAHQAPLSIRFPRQEYWSGLPFLPPGESFQPRDRTHISCIVGRLLTH